MPDTKIKKTIDGWCDVDSPNFYPLRRLARDARRASLLAQGKKLPTKKQVNTMMTTNVTTLGYTPGLGQAPATIQLSALQQKLYDRLTAQQGVTPDDALQIITSNGYNKAASYGHMRAAGANHAEARIVIDLSDPDVSLVYGKQRGYGLDHTEALTEALKS